MNTALYLPPGADREALLRPWRKIIATRTQGWQSAIDASSEYRVEVTRNSPVRFALIYLARHLASKETGGRLSLAQHHIDMAAAGAAWRHPGRHRDLVVAPRGGAKSTWCLVLTLWALAHGHRRFCAWFSDSAEQAKLHMAALRAEIESNTLLRLDFPELCPPRGRPRGGRDSQDTYISRGGAKVGARGMDAHVLGFKLGTDRPDPIILDDVEPQSANYSPNLRRKRLESILQTVLPMNDRAAVLLVGTVVMYGSIMHGAVRAAVGESRAEEWIADEGFTLHYVPAIVTDPATGSRWSFWEQRYPLTYLESIEHTRNYALNFAGRPPLPGGHHWKAETFRHSRVGQFTVPLLVMQVDPAPTAGPDSDYNAVVVGGEIAGRPGHVQIEFARQFRDTTGAVAQRIAMVCRQNPRIRRVRVESNMGHALGQALARPGALPAGVVLEMAPAGYQNKVDRIAAGLERYEESEVWHLGRLPELERECQLWPDGEHDDLPDAAAALLAFFPSARSQPAG